MKLRIELTLALLAYEAAISEFSATTAAGERERALRKLEAKREILQELINCVDAEM